MKPTYTTHDKYCEVMRELGLRFRVYSRWVEDGRMRSEDAGRYIAIMQAIADDYRAQLEAEPLPLFRKAVP